MLKIIKPKDHDIHDQRLGALLDLLTVYQGFDLPSEMRTQCHFIVAENNEMGVYGGAVLYPLKLISPVDFSSLDTNQEKAIKFTPFLEALRKKYWLARICLCLDPGISVTKILETQDICHRFYKDLYPAFIKIGSELGIDCLVYTMRVSDTYKMKTHESWPYQLNERLEDPDPGFIHGLLVLKGKAFKVKGFKPKGFKPKPFKGKPFKTHQDNKSRTKS